MYILAAAGALLYGALSLIALFVIAFWRGDMLALALVVTAGGAAYFSQFGTCTALGCLERGETSSVLRWAKVGLILCGVSIAFGFAAFVRIFLF